MKFIGDFHIHSHFSIATSKNLIPEYLDYWARIKGIKVIGTGDFTHPGWVKELKEKLEPAEPGLFKLKDKYKKDKAFETHLFLILKYDSFLLLRLVIFIKNMDRYVRCIMLYLRLILKQ